MADVNYNEVTHSVVYTDGTTAATVPDPMFHWDVRFPERLTRLHLSPEFSRLALGVGLSVGGSGTGSSSNCHSPIGRRQQRRSRADRAAAVSSGRYRTQPITFDEIAEVDEDGAPTGGSSSTASGATHQTDQSASTVGSTLVDSCKESKASFKIQMANFSKSMDGLVPGIGAQPHHHRAAAAASTVVHTGSDKENMPCEPDVVSTSFTASISGSDIENGSNSDVFAAPDGDARNSNDDGVTTAAVGNTFQMPSIVDIGRHRRKRSGRRLRNRNSVPEEVMSDQLDRADDDVEVEMSR